jgi:hypothetical protein
MMNQLSCSTNSLLPVLNSSKNLIQPLNMLRKKLKKSGCEMGKQKAGYD